MEKKYDIALSFAGDDREYVEKVAFLLKEQGIKVFYDKFEVADLWGKNLYDHLSDIYSNNAKYVVIFISKHYLNKPWTKHERQSAQANALFKENDYLLPVKFDDTEIPGIPKTTSYIDLRIVTPAGLVELIIEKLKINPQDSFKTATLIFFRKPRPLTFELNPIPIPSERGNDKPVLISIDGKEIEKIIAGETKQVQVNSGLHYITAKFDYIISIETSRDRPYKFPQTCDKTFGSTFKTGNTYNIEIYIRQKGFLSRYREMELTLKK